MSLPSPNLSRTNTRGELEVGLAIPESGGKAVAVVGIAVACEAAAPLGSDPDSFLRRHLRPALECPAAGATRVLEQERGAPGEKLGALPEK